MPNVRLTRVHDWLPDFETEDAMKYSRILMSMLLVVLITACGSGSVNENIRIARGETQEGGARSVNGNIIIGSNAVLKGDINSVNGMVDVDDGASTGDVKTVNGSIRLGPGASTGNLDSVNGNIRMKTGATTTGVRLVNGTLDTEEGSEIKGNVTLVNGSAEVFGTLIAGNFTTYAGKVTLAQGSEIGGDLVVKKPKGTFSAKDKPRVVIGPDSRIAGKIIAEREIHLYVHESASIGSVEGAEVQRFSGSVSELD